MQVKEWARMPPKEAALLVEQAKDAKRLFGAIDPEGVYRQLVKLLHPDRNPGDSRIATAFAKLTQLYAVFNGKTARAPIVIGKWVIGDLITNGDICDLYHAENGTTAGVFKIARNGADNDLVEAEWAHLQMLHQAFPDKKHFSDSYLPKPIDWLEASDRRANVFAPLVPAGKTTVRLPLYEIIGFFRKQLDFRHVVWMVNRALSALGYAHETVGVVHGAVLPCHLMYGASDHSLSLVDWCYSVTAESGKPIPAKVKAYADFYPPEVNRKQAPTPATDIYMLMVSMQLACPDAPKRFKALFDYCLADSPNARPQNAWALQDKWRELAEQEYGPPKFVELKIPIT